MSIEHGNSSGTQNQHSSCPGCDLPMPVKKTATYDGYYNTSPECWELYTEVLGAEFGNVLLYGQVHQLTVDAYAIQHGGGNHPDKSMGIHLCGLHLILDHGFRSPDVPPLLQRLARKIQIWPRFSPPAGGGRGTLTVCDVALCDSVEDHIRTVREWARVIWETWSAKHGEVAHLVERHLPEMTRSL